MPFLVLADFKKREKNAGRKKCAEGAGEDKCKIGHVFVPISLFKR